MKVFKNILTIITLFSVILINTKQIQQPIAQPTQAIPTTQPTQQIKQPILSENEQEKRLQWLFAQPKPWGSQTIQWLRDNFKYFSPNRQRIINDEQERQKQVMMQPKVQPTKPTQPNKINKPREPQKPVMQQPIKQQKPKEQKERREPREKKEKKPKKEKQPRKETKIKQPRQQKPSQQPIKKQPQPKVQPPIINLVEPTIKDLKPIKKYFATNNLILLMDPEKVEKIESDSRAMVMDALLGMYEQAAPLLMTSNILEIIASLRQKIGANNLQQLRNSTYNTVMPFSQQLVNNYKLPESNIVLILLSLINFDDKNFKCYFHKSADLVLIIPQKYIQANLLKENLMGDDQIKACGFNPNIFTPINNLNADNLLQQIKSHQSKFSQQSQFINNLTASFTPQKKNEQLISPLDDTKWIFYMSGHGGPAYQPVSQMPGPLTPIMRVAGLTINNFKELMRFFDEDISTAYLHYTTCFSGGYNQTFVNEILSSLNVNFIVSSEGVGERKVSGIQLKMMFSSQAPYIRLATHPFTDYFKLLRLYVSNPEEFVRIKPAKKDPIAVILKTIHTDMKEENQPFVRFPGAAVFGALSITKNTKVLTQVMVRAHEIEKKPINFSSSDIDMIIINPSRIDVTLNLGTIGTKEHKAIVSPTPTTMAEYHEAIHVFKEINCNTNLQTLLFNFIYLNASMNTITFVVKKLTGIHNIPGKQGQANTINNLIIQINKQVLFSGIMTANVQISFEVNGTIYQASTAVRNFDYADFVYQELDKLAFVAQAESATDMNTLASKFLKPQDVNKLKKPITLNGIAQLINNKIDVYEPSLKETEGHGKDLLEYVKERTK